MVKTTERDAPVVKTGCSFESTLGFGRGESLGLGVDIPWF